VSCPSPSCRVLVPRVLVPRVLVPRVLVPPRVPPVREGLGVLRRAVLPPGPAEREGRRRAAPGGALGLRGRPEGAAGERGEHRRPQQGRGLAGAVRAQLQGQPGGRGLSFTTVSRGHEGIGLFRVEGAGLKFHHS